MLMGLMRVIGIFYYWTWFIWPFVFVFSLAHGISSIMKDNGRSDKTLLMVSAVSLLIILAGITAPNFSF